MSWDSLKYQFNNRHDFESEQLAVLKKKFPKIKFSGIPDAWIVIVDQMLRNMRELGTVKEIRQEYGQLVVEFLKGYEIPDNKACIQEAESKIYNLDKDLNHVNERLIEETDARVLN